MSINAIKRAVTMSPLSRGGAFAESYVFGLMCSPPKDTPPAVVFALSLPEVVQEILSWCDFPTLMAFSRVNQYCRELAMTAVRIKLRDYVQPFISRFDFWPFMDMLDAVGGAIVGSLPHLLLSDNAIFHVLKKDDGGTRFNPPSDMNLVVRNGMLDFAIDWLTIYRGYTEWQKIKMQDAFKEVATEVHRGTRPAANGAKVSVLDWLNVGRSSCYIVQSTHVTVTHSRHGVVKVALAIPITCQANFITSTRLYSPYPHLITDPDTLRSDKRALRGVRLPCHAKEVHESNIYWPKPCGPFCPGMARKTVGDKGIASFVWNDKLEVPISRFPDTDYLLAESVVVWQFSKSCENLKCRNFRTSPFYECGGFFAYLFLAPYSMVPSRVTGCPNEPDLSCPSSI
jgi:hypothetical protein